MRPKRIQRKRTKGWRMPDGAMYVGRPTRWGNPFLIDSCLETSFADTAEEAREVCVRAFREWLEDGTSWTWGGSDKLRERILDSLEDLRGKDLCCWCALDQPCHADVLLELANREVG